MHHCHYYWELKATYWHDWCMNSNTICCHDITTLAVLSLYPDNTDIWHMSNCNDRCEDVTTLTSQPLLSDSNDRNCNIGIHVVNNTTCDDRLTWNLWYWDKASCPSAQNMWTPLEIIFNVHRLFSHIYKLQWTLHSLVHTWVISSPLWEHIFLIHHHNWIYRKTQHGTRCLTNHSTSN